MSFNSSFSWTCTSWIPVQHSALFQLGNVCFFLAYASPNGKYGLLFLHSSLIAGYLFYSSWAWNVVCTPTVFAWALILVLLNTGQVLYISYQLRPAQFSKHLEHLYKTLFAPIKVDRNLFSKLISNQNAHFITLQGGDAYAVENLSRTDRLGLLICGRVQVVKGGKLIHTIESCEFLDSPEFNSTSLIKEKKRFEVSLVAACECEILVWQRENIEYIMIKNHRVRHVMQGLIAADICSKLKSLQSQVQEEFSHSLDMRIVLFENKQAIKINEPVNENDEDRNHLRVPCTIKRKPPISLPLDGNIELEEWYHAFLKHELVGYVPIKHNL